MLPFVLESNPTMPDRRKNCKYEKLETQPWKASYLRQTHRQSVIGTRNGHLGPRVTCRLGTSAEGL